MDREDIVKYIKSNHCGSVGWVMLNAWKEDECQELFYMSKREGEGGGEMVRQC